MIRPATRSDLPAITALLRRANATPYDIGAVAEEKAFGRGYGGEAAPRVFVENDQIIGVAVTCAGFLRILAVDPPQRRRGVGSQLLRNEHVVFAEPGNYFTPGVIESDAATRAFLRKHGWIEDRWTYNLTTSQLRHRATSQLERSVTPIRATGAKRDAVLAFAEEHFSPIWRFEAEQAGENLFYIEHDNRIAGFSAHDANNRHLGTFGPTGVLPELRGLGYGRALLLASLNDLADAGYASAIIPWTDAVDFYGKSCGAVVSARFVTCVRREQ
jgi:GNAT superfamily N-acetyltransferase